MTFSFSLVLNQSLEPLLQKLTPTCRRNLLESGLDEGGSQNAPVHMQHAHHNEVGEAWQVGKFAGLTKGFDVVKV